MKEESVNLWKSIREKTLCQVRTAGELTQTNEILKIIKENFNNKAKFTTCGNTWIGWVLEIENDFKKIEKEMIEKEAQDKTRIFIENRVREGNLKQAEKEAEEEKKRIKKETLKNPKMFPDSGNHGFLDYGTPEYEAKKLEKEKKVKKMVAKENKRIKRIEKITINK